MAAVVAARLLLLALCSPLPVSADVYSITDAGFITECVNEHNNYRSATTPVASNMFKMTWDEALAKSAKAWSKKCTFKHNSNLNKNGVVHPTFYPVGENLYATTGSFNTKDAIKAWNSEVTNYDFDTNTCKKYSVCGHYTQVVWENTYKVGCAVTSCPNGIKSSGLKGSAVVFVCNYAPAGNYAGRSPFAKGTTACSGCTTCSKKLCTDATRDKQQQYPNWMPDFGAASISLHDQLIFLITIILIYILQ
ncbi:GLIPR1-like protein 1 [Amblyraja radiata]|uniref:GLIPR1-like protein 1 n=1 Tax=Amblyraja radiata TaxID=386614 RepID=UPI00140324D7|nr:GLIPR1-like protein 1 [Amblyraja radiata]